MVTTNNSIKFPTKFNWQIKNWKIVENWLNTIVWHQKSFQVTSPFFLTKFKLRSLPNEWVTRTHRGRFFFSLQRPVANRLLFFTIIIIIMTTIMHKDLGPREHSEKKKKIRERNETMVTWHHFSSDSDTFCSHVLLPTRRGLSSCFPFIISLPTAFLPSLQSDWLIFGYLYKNKRSSPLEHFCQFS